MPKKEVEYTKQVSVKLDHETYEWLDRVARQAGMTKSQYVRKLVYQSLNKLNGRA